ALPWSKPAARTGRRAQKGDGRVGHDGHIKRTPFPLRSRPPDRHRYEPRTFQPDCARTSDGRLWPSASRSWASPSGTHAGLLPARRPLRAVEARVVGDAARCATSATLLVQGGPPTVS